MAKKKRRRSSPRKTGLSAGAVVGIVLATLLVVVLVVVLFFLGMNLTKASTVNQMYRNAAAQQRYKEAQDKANWDQAVDTGKNIFALYGVVRAVQDIQANNP